MNKIPGDHYCWGIDLTLEFHLVCEEQETALGPLEENRQNVVDEQIQTNKEHTVARGPDFDLIM